MSKEEIAWDLSGLFPRPDHKKVQEAKTSIVKRGEKLAKKYQGKITEEYSAKDVLTLLQELEEFTSDLRDLGLYARLSFFANMTLPETKKLHSQVQKISSKIDKKLAFIELALGDLLTKKPGLIDDPILENYKHHLEKLHRRIPHKLSETEEQLVIEKDQFGIIGWQQLQSSWLNTREFEVEVEGEKKILSYGEADGLLTHPDRATRTSANKSIYGKLSEQGEIFASALRNIASDWIQMVDRRDYDSSMHQSLIVNDVEQQTVDNLMKAIEDHVELYRRYLTLKAKIMGLEKLGCQDIVAPLPDAPSMDFTWNEARELVTKAYESFDKDYAQGVKDMFKANHIDASPRFGKRNGAFCSRWYNGKTSFILQTFTGSLRNVYTLGHELGHATHNYYASREQTLFNTRAPMVVAETASIFGELLLTDLLLKEAESDDEKKAILCRVLDGAGMAIFQVSARVWFEKSLYEAIDNEEYLDFGTISKYWTAGRDKIYGEVVKWFEELDGEWTMKPHYYMPNFRFYNYPYVFGQLFVYALYQKYQEQGASFIPKLKEALAAGGSLSPKEIGEIFGLDISDPEFWKLGMKQYEFFVEELEKLV
ncbi:MAG: hypothetical protein GF308_13320 [Candidatus Heimdallarchaeota archaeon]|nr:hypothetical protein [Candidatus Heimdallarchaeota archaeon]